MRHTTTYRFTPVLLAALLTSAIGATADDWPQWGRTPDKNFFSPARNLPSEFEAGF